MIAPNSGYVPITKGHNADEKGVFCRYSVYLNKTDMPVIIDGTAAECAKILGRSRSSFYCLVNRVRNGRNKKYSVFTRMLDASDDEETKN